MTDVLSAPTRVLTVVQHVRSGMKFSFHFWYRVGAQSVKILKHFRFLD